MSVCMKRLLNIPKRYMTKTIKYKPFKYNGVSTKPSELIQNHTMDTSIWNDIKLVDDDIFINTSAKSGTTWTQEICTQLLYNGDYKNILGVETAFSSSMWAAIKVLPKEMKINFLNQQLENPLIRRRVIKTHETVESMPFNPNSKYIFVGRDYRDIVWSWYNHQSLIYEHLIDEVNNTDVGYIFSKMMKFNFKDGSFTEYDLWKMMLNEGNPDHEHPDGWPFWSQLWTIGSWWNVRNLPNIKIIHYNNLKEDLSGNMRDIANFLEIEIDENNFDNLVENCTFQKMKNKKEPLGETGKQWFADPRKFFYFGETKRWENILTNEDTEKYRNLAKRYLDDDGIYWMETGKFS